MTESPRLASAPVSVSSLLSLGFETHAYSPERQSPPGASVGSKIISASEIPAHGCAGAG